MPWWVYNAIASPRGRHPAETPLPAQAAVRTRCQHTNMCSIPDDAPPPDDPRSLAVLEQEICQLAAHLAAATCRWLLLVAEFDARRGWAEWGVNSCARWLSWRCGIGLHTAREHVRVASRLDELPLVRARFASGELSYSKVRAITRVATPETEADMVMIGRHATGYQMEKLARGYGQALRATTERAREAPEREELVHYWDDDGMLRIEGRLTAENGALLLAAIDAASDNAEGHLGQRRAQGLVSLVRGEVGDEARDPAPPELVVHVDVESLAGEQVGLRSEIEDGPVVAPETMRRLGCDAAVVRIIERDGKPLSVGRRTRTIPAALRRALRGRDRGCRFPGCTHSRFLHAHHIKHWARGGPTELGNLVQLCSRHHRLVHEGGYKVEVEGSGVVRFRRPDGAELVPSGPCMSARGATIEHQHHAQRLQITGDTCRPLSAGDVLDYDIAVGGLMAARPPDG